MPDGSSIILMTKRLTDDQSGFDVEADTFKAPPLAVFSPALSITSHFSTKLSHFPLMHSSSTCIYFFQLSAPTGGGVVPVMLKCSCMCKHACPLKHLHLLPVLPLKLMLNHGENEFIK